MSETARRRGRKYESVIAGAREIFLRDGFSGANVDEIARVAGVSKATLYAYFPDKAQMFVAVVQAEIARVTQIAEAHVIHPALPIERALMILGEMVVAYMHSEFRVRLLRICMAESERFPELGQDYYAIGLRPMRDRLARYFDSAAAAGRLRLGDATLAAEQFLALARGEGHIRSILGVPAPEGEADLAHVAEAVRMFLARYGA